MSIHYRPDGSRANRPQTIVYSFLISADGLRSAVRDSPIGLDLRIYLGLLIFLRIYPLSRRNPLFVGRVGRQTRRSLRPDFTFALCICRPKTRPPANGATLGEFTRPRIFKWRRALSRLLLASRVSQLARLPPLRPRRRRRRLSFPLRPAGHATPRRAASFVPIVTRM